MTPKYLFMVSADSCKIVNVPKYFKAKFLSMNEPSISKLLFRGLDHYASLDMYIGMPFEKIFLSVSTLVC